MNWFLFKRMSRALWFLPALFSAFAILVLAAAYFANIFFPEPIKAEDLPITVSQDAVHNILSIVAASMLTVAVFALSTLVNLLANASQTGSPRAVPLIVEDRRAQTSISVFIGAFLFSIVGLIGISGEIYSTSGRLVLFGATIIVILATRIRADQVDWTNLHRRWCRRNHGSCGKSDPACAGSARTGGFARMLQGNNRISRRLGRPFWADRLRAAFRQGEAPGDS